MVVGFHLKNVSIPHIPKAYERRAFTAIRASINYTLVFFVALKVMLKCVSMCVFETLVEPHSISFGFDSFFVGRNGGTIRVKNYCSICFSGVQVNWQIAMCPAMLKVSRGHIETVINRDIYQVYYFACPLLWLHFSQCHTWWSSSLYSSNYGFFCHMQSRFAVDRAPSSYPHLEHWCHRILWFLLCTAATTAAFSLPFLRCVCALLPQTRHRSATILQWRSRLCLLGYVSIMKMSKSGKLSGWMLQKTRNVF